MSQIVDPTGAPLVSYTQEADWLQPESYVFYTKGHRGPHGEIHARDVFMVIDPTWLGLPEYGGMTYVIFGVPGYLRPEQPEAVTRTYPFLGADVEITTEAEQDLLYALPEHERQFILAGGIDPKGRFKYHLMTTHPKPFRLPTVDLRALTSDILVLFDRNLLSWQLPNLPANGSGREISEQSAPQAGSGAVVFQLEEPSPNETADSETGTTDSPGVEEPLV